MTFIKINVSGTDYTVDGASATIAWTNNTTATPKVNGGSASEVQVQNFNNPMYTLQGVLLTGRSGTLDYNTLLTASKSKNVTGDKLYLKINYGSDLVASDGSTTTIPIIIKSWNFNISPLKNDLSGSTRYVPSVTIVCQETE